MLLEDLTDDGNCGVDWVGDHQDKGTRAVPGHPLGEITDDTSVDLYSFFFFCSTNTSEGGHKGRHMHMHAQTSTKNDNNG